MKSILSMIKPGPIALVALAALIWAVIAVTLAALAPTAYVPRIFNSSHVEHLAAFYLVTLIGAAAFGRLSLLRLVMAMVIFAAALGAVRLFQTAHRPWAIEDFLCDIAGIWTAVAPIIVARFRDDRALAAPSGSPWSR